MYEEGTWTALRDFATFWHQVEVIAAMELGGRINAENAYQMIKEELKELKKCRKQFNKKNEC